MARMFATLHIDTDPNAKIEFTEEIPSIGNPHRVLRIDDYLSIFLTTAQALLLAATITDQLGRETEVAREAV